MKRIRRVFDLIIQIVRRRRRTNVLSGYRCLSWEETFFLDSLDQDYPLGLSNLNRLSHGHQPRPKKK